MSVLTRSQARVRKSLTYVASTRITPSGWVIASSSELLQQPSLEGGVLCSDRAFGARPFTMAMKSERSLAVHTSRADCLTCPSLIRENQFVSNTTGREYFATDIKPDEVY